MRTINEAKLKQTSFGIIPEDWEIVTIESATEKIIDYRGKTPKKSHSGIPLITAKIVKDGHILEPNEFISEGDYESWMRRGLPQKGDVIVTTEAPLGEVAQLDDRKIALAQRIIALRGKRNFLSNDFLRYALQSPMIQNEITKRESGTTVTGIKQSELRKVLLPVPSFEEQAAIAKILSDLDSKVELNHRMDRTLEAIGQSIFKNWFVDFKFPNEESKPYKSSGGEMVDSELGKIPKAWKVDSIAALASYVNGKAFTVKAAPKGRMIIKIIELNSGPGSTTRYYDGHAEQENIAFFDDILFSWSATLDVYRWFGPESVINQHIFKVIPKNYPKAFVYYALKQAMPDFQAIAAGKATTMGHIQRHHLEEQKLVIPPNSILGTFDKLVSPLFNLIASNAAQSNKLSQIRDLLLPKLLSGQIRVKPLEEAMGNK